MEWTHHPQRPAPIGEIPLLVLGSAGLAVFGVALAAVVQHWAPLMGFDRWAGRAVHDAATAGHLPVRAAFAVTDLASPLPLDAASVVVVVLAALLLGARCALFAVVAFLGPAVGSVLKELVERPRPGPRIALYADTGYSFPSGHAVGATTLGLILLVLVAAWRGGARRVPRVGGPLLGLWMVVVGGARVVLGVHFVTDVVGGAGLAVAWTSAAALLCRPAPRRRPAGQRSAEDSGVIEGVDQGIAPPEVGPQDGGAVTGEGGHLAGGRGLDGEGPEDDEDPCRGVASGVELPVEAAERGRGLRADSEGPR